MRALTGKNANAAEELCRLADQEKLALHIVEIDITDEASVEQAIETVVGTTGRIDVVGNNAGVAFNGPLEAFTLDQVHQQFETNVFGAWLVNRATLPHMRRQGSGLLLHIGSIAGRIALPFLGLYGATKSALEELTESYRYELAPFGIDVAIIEPGTFPTPISANSQLAADSQRFALYQNALDAFDEKFYAENRSATPPNPQDVADAVATVIGQPAGERSLHTVVATIAQRKAPQAVNDAVTQATQSFFESLQLPKAQPSSARTTTRSRTRTRDPQLCEALVVAGGMFTVFAWVWLGNFSGYRVVATGRPPPVQWRQHVPGPVGGVTIMRFPQRLPRSPALGKISPRPPMRKRGPLEGTP